LNLGAFLLLAAWIYLNGIPDWTTQAGKSIIAATCITALNATYLTFASRKPPRAQAMAGYAAALAAIAAARKTSLDGLRGETIQLLYDLPEAPGMLLADQLVETAKRLQGRAEYDKALESLAHAPVAREIFFLAGAGNAAGNDDAMIRLEGLLAFIHTREAEEAVLEALDHNDMRLDALFPDSAMPMAPSAPQPETIAVDADKPRLADISYEDVVNATLRIVSIDQISGLPVTQRRALFSRVRGIMEKDGGSLNPTQVEEIEMWVSANSR
jgi:hypothetical protein